jgi:alpha-tubulin suppressor-like RCC1 family protein
MARALSLPSRILSEDDESSDDAVESMCHHQLYGFGHNDGMKLGLVSPATGKTAEVLLPRRVALHCKVWPGIEEPDENLPPSGIYAIAASARHSAALVRRATGAIELYTWGDATFGALDSFKGDTPKGQDHQLNGRFTHLPLAVTVPTLVKGLSHSSMDHNTNSRDRIPVQVALGPRSTFVTSLSGQCLSFGKSECGLLGQGDGITSTVEPGLIVFPSAGNGVEPKIKSISVGAQHAVAVASDGRVFAWGKNEGHIMGFDSALRKNLSLRSRSAGNGRERSPLHDEIEWIPREIEFPAVHQPTTSKKKLIRVLSESRTVHLEGAPPRAAEKEKKRVVQAWAGTDLTVFVTESGSVLSCGASSGRLGLGETSSTPIVVTPTPMFGGLHLWR